MCALIAASWSCKAQSITFSATYSNNKLLFNWSTDANEMTDRFEVEKSSDGVNFKTAALVFTSEKKGLEDYKYYEMVSLNETVYYRLKIYGLNNKITYSKLLSFPVTTREKKE